MARISRAEQRKYATRKAVFAGMTRVDMFLIKGPKLTVRVRPILA
jgi:hypothetical protein